MVDKLQWCKNELNDIANDAIWIAINFSCELIGTVIRNRKRERAEKDMCLQWKWQQNTSDHNDCGFLDISNHWSTMRHSKWHSLSSVHCCLNGYHMKVCVYHSIWSCNLIVIIVELQNNELNCLHFFFFTYNSQCTITVPYLDYVILSHETRERESERKWA